MMLRAESRLADLLEIELVIGESLSAFPPLVTSFDPFSHLPLGEAVGAYKVRRIRQALRAANGNQTRAAELLGMRQSNLSRLMKSLGMRELVLVPSNVSATAAPISR